MDGSRNVMNLCSVAMVLRLLVYRDCLSGIEDNLSGNVYAASSFPMLLPRSWEIQSDLESFKLAVTQGPRSARYKGKDIARKIELEPLKSSRPATLIPPAVSTTFSQLCWRIPTILASLELQILTQDWLSPQLDAQDFI